MHVLALPYFSTYVHEYEMMNKQEGVATRYKTLRVHLSRDCRCSKIEMANILLKSPSMPIKSYYKTYLFPF